jgi:DNA-binding NarL/FixJ family response regulator
MSLRVRLHAADPDRRARLARLVVEAGHAVVAGDAPADALLAEPVAGEAPPLAGALPLLLLSDAAARRDPWGTRAAGLLPRAASPRQLDAALRAVAAGLTVRVGQDGALPGFAAAEEAVPALLTPREIEILAAIGEGMSNKAVARRLGISAHTVKFHLEAIFAKLDVGSRAEAVAKGLRRGLIEL